MFNKTIKNKRKNTENKPKEKSPEFYSFMESDLEKHWSDNNCQILILIPGMNYIYF